MTQDNGKPPSSDALLARYHAAQALLDAADGSFETGGSSATTRAHILNYAANIATNSVAARAIEERAKSTFDTRKPAANESQWKIRALATVAMFGITSLLLLQWERGTPEEKDAALSTARPPIAAPTAQAVPQVAIAPAPSPAAAAPTTSAAPKPMHSHAKSAPKRADTAAHPSADAASPLVPAVEASAAEPAVTATPLPSPAIATAAIPAPAAPAMAKAQSAPMLRSAPAANVLGQSAAPLERTASNHQALFAAIASADAAGVQQALANGADKNAKSSGTPAISLCVQTGKLPLVQLLAAADADLNAPDALGTTPLAHARARGFDAIADALVALGAR